MRNLTEITKEIRADWVKPYLDAKPYLDVMSTMGQITDSYGFDEGKSIVMYFLGNASTWKGETARRIKLELNKMLKV